MIADAVVAPKAMAGSKNPEGARQCRTPSEPVQINGGVEIAIA
ncbi:hypothetical protein [Coleofasciculus sp. G3-WIS-01]